MSPFFQIFSSDARIFNKLAATTQADARIFNKLAAHCSILKVPFLTNFLSKGPRRTHAFRTTLQKMTVALRDGHGYIGGPGGSPNFHTARFLDGGRWQHCSPILAR